jgi:ribosomal protein S18 acetylase RimI-like enzyme
VTAPLANLRVVLRPMAPDELRSFLEHGRVGYVEQMVEYGGRTREAAQAKADADYASLFPDGVPSPGHHLFAAELDGERVGHLWLAPQQPGWADGTAFVYDVEVAPTFRGKGYGRAIMLAAEEHARRIGASVLALNVFGGNTAAIALYTSLGYQVSSQQMQKRL